MNLKQFFVQKSFMQINKFHKVFWTYVSINPLCRFTGAFLALFIAIISHMSGSLRPAGDAKIFLRFITFIHLVLPLELIDRSLPANGRISCELKCHRCCLQKKRVFVFALALKIDLQMLPLSIQKKHLNCD